MNRIKYAIRNAELNSLVTSLQEVYNDKKENYQNDKFLEIQFNELSKLSEKFNLAINQDRITSILKEKDLIRNNKLSAMNLVLKGYMALPVKDISNSAKKIYEVFSKYGIKVNTKNYVETSGLLQSLLSDLSDENLQKDIDNLYNFSYAIKELSDAQDDFFNTFVNYTDEKSAELSRVKATDLKNPIIKHINEKIIPYLTALYNVEEYNSLAMVVEQLILGLNSKIKQRKTRKDLKKTE